MAQSGGGELIRFWILRRYLASGKVLLNVTSVFAILGMALGVACLVVAMSVVSGYEKTLKSALTDYAGHITLLKRGGNLSAREKAVSQLQEMVPGYLAHTSFVQMEGMIAHSGKISGVLVEGLDSDTVSDVLKLSHRLVEGEFRLEGSKEIASAVIGTGIAKNFGLKVGDRFRFVRPMGSRKRSDRLRAKMQEFVVAGTIDLGKIEYNERLLLTDIGVAQRLRNMGSSFSGLKILIADREQAKSAASVLNQNLGYPYVARDWMALNRNLLQAIRLEKPVIFFVILIMVVAACFNVCSHLLVDVLKKYSDVSVFRTMGASKRSLMVFFSVQGMVVGLVGTFLGIVFGWLLSLGFVGAQEYFGFVPGETYKLAKIGIEMRWTDLALVAIASLFILFFGDASGGLSRCSSKSCGGIEV